MRWLSRKSMSIALLVAVAAALLYGAFVWSGVYNVGADDPHTRPMLLMMQTLRARSIHVRSQDITVPDLDDPALVLKGAGQYAAMCTGCHLAPGMADSEFRRGLYPQPPALSQVRVDPKDAFWVIKHGIKMSAMPAWGMSHDDPTIWSMVAFLRRLPDMSPAQYRDIVARAPADDDMDGMAMPGMDDGTHDHDHAQAHDPATAEEPAAESPHHVHDH